MQKYFPYLGLVAVLVVAVLITSNLPVAKVGLNRSQADSTDPCCLTSAGFPYTDANSSSRACPPSSNSSLTSSCLSQWSACWSKFLANPRLCEAPTPTPTTAVCVNRDASGQCLGGGLIPATGSCVVQAVRLPAYVTEDQAYTATFVTNPPSCPGLATIRFTFQGGPGGDPKSGGQETYVQSGYSATYTAPKAVNRRSGDTYMVYGAQAFDSSNKPLGPVGNLATPMGVRPVGYQEAGNGSTPTPTTANPAVVIGTMSGKVTDSAGNPVAGVNLYDNDRVLVKNAGGSSKCATNPEELQGGSLQRTNITPPSNESGVVFLVTGQNFCGEMSIQLSYSNKACLADPSTCNPSGASFNVHVITPTQGLVVIPRDTIDDIAGYGMAYLLQYPRASDYIFFGDLNGEAVQTDLGFSTATPRDDYENHPGGGTLKIGTTDSDGQIVFDQGFIDFLKITYPCTTYFDASRNAIQSCLNTSNGNKVISLPKNSHATIPSGLTVRYEKGASKTTKIITFANNLYDLSNTLSGGGNTPVTTGTIPKIISFAPLAAKAGDTVTVKGANFNSNGKALIAGRTISAAAGTTATSFKFVVPTGLGVGAYKLQISTAGVVSDFSPKLLSVVNSSNSPIIYLTSPAKLKPGRSYNVTIYGTNLSAIANLTTAARGISIPSDSLVDLSTLDSFKARFRIVVDSTALDGPNYLTLTDDNDQTITFPVVIAR